MSIFKLTVLCSSLATSPAFCTGKPVFPRNRRQGLFSGACFVPPAPFDATRNITKSSRFAVPSNRNERHALHHPAQRPDSATARIVTDVRCNAH
uniref:Putative secreted protein n=1 Tax=Ixodes ricinus TaxID=34613 RepID=A0A6B0U5F7_IXORI